MNCFFESVKAILPLKGHALVGLVGDVALGPELLYALSLNYQCLHHTEISFRH